MLSYNNFIKSPLYEELDNKGYSSGMRAYGSCLQKLKYNLSSNVTLSFHTPSNLLNYLTMCYFPGKHFGIEL